MRHRWLPAVAVATAAIGCAALVQAFELERVDQNPCGAARNLAWAARRAAVSTLPLPPALQSLGDEAQLRWNSRVGSFQFDGGVGALCNTQDHVVSLGFRSTACDGSPLDSDVLALTVIHWNVSTGEMLGADTVFNADRPALLTDSSLFLQVAMHELGHALGLDHSDACGDSGAGTLMQSVLPVAGRRYDAPQADDIAGATFIYGPAEPAGAVPDGANGCAVRPPRRHDGTTMFFLGLLLILARRQFHCGRGADAVAPGREEPTQESPDTAVDEA